MNIHRMKDNANNRKGFGRRDRYSKAVHYARPFDYRGIELAKVLKF